MRRTPLVFTLILALVAASCQAPTPLTPSPTAAVDTPLPATSTLPAASPTVPATATEAPPPTLVITDTVPPATTTPEAPEEAIWIREPGPGSRVISPILVAGTANPTFEQNLVVRVLRDDGSLVSEVPTTIQTETGQRGDFLVEVPLSLTGETNLFIQVLSDSPRDGGITHLSSTAVIFTPTGPADLRQQTDPAERISISQPAVAETIRGGSLHVEGFALAGFEQSLLVEVQDASGTVVGSQPVMVQSPELGVPGPFSADVPYTVSQPGPGRVVVRDISPAFGGDAHLSSVEVTLEP